MRSFIKSHRRNESSISEDLDLEHPPSINTYSTPASSPILQHSNQFSPPPRTIYNNSKSSPKKLLTPIKNLFSSSNHGSKNNSPIDQSKRPLYKSKRNSHGAIIASDIPRNMSFEKTRVLSSPMVKATFSTSIPSLVSPFQETPQTSLASVNKIPPINDQRLEIPTLKPAITFNEHARPQSIRENSWNDSTTSIVDSESKIDIKQVSFESPIYVENANSNSSDDISETSSQFSFIKDRKGGKNTSVKYYKTPSKPEPESVFIAQDLGYDEEDLEDYDFESNGLYDEFDEEDVNYNNAFDDEEDVYYHQEFDDGDEEDEINFNRVFDDRVDYNRPVNVVKIEVEEADDDFAKDKVFDDDELNFNYSMHNVDIGDEKMDNTLTASGNTGTSNSSHYNDNISFGDYDRDLDELSDGYDLGNINEITYEQHEMTQSGQFNSLADLTTTSIHTTSFNFKNHNMKATPKISHIFDSLNVYGPNYKSQPFYLSFHSSIDGFDVSDVESDASNIYGDDILENYLDMSKSPSTDPPSAHRGMQIRSPSGVDDINDPLYPIEIGSPLINGVTIGSNLNHRSQSRIFANNSDLQTPTTNRSFIHRLGVDELDYISPDRSLHLNELSIDASEACKFKYLTSFHSSVSDGLNLKIAQKIEEFDQFSNVRLRKSNQVKMNDIPSPATNKAARESIHQMMALLGSLEGTSTGTKEATKEDSSDNIEVMNNKLRRRSILGMMDMLANLEIAQPNLRMQDVSTTNDKIKENRKSILDMMSTLDSIGSTVSSNEVDARSKRNSINFMMNALEQLNLISSGASDTQAARIKQRNSQKAKKSTKKLRRLSSGKVDQNAKSKRYSWTDHDGSHNVNAVGHVVNESKGTEDIQENLDEDIIDEINQLPEDFDFEEHESQWKSANNKQLPSFYRSNSYNKKPVREIRDNNYQSNKIQTSGKTVTFYKSKSLNVPTELAKQRSINRGASLRSNGSFACVSEEAEEE